MSCAVCLENADTWYRIDKCGHVYCGGCVRRLSICPECRISFNRNLVQRTFLPVCNHSDANAEVQRLRRVIREKDQMIESLSGRSELLATAHRSATGRSQQERMTLESKVNAMVDKLEQISELVTAELTTNNSRRIEQHTSSLLREIALLASMTREGINSASLSLRSPERNDGTIRSRLRGATHGPIFSSRSTAGPTSATSPDTTSIPTTATNGRVPDAPDRGRQYSSDDSPFLEVATDHLSRAINSSSTQLPDGSSSFHIPSRGALSHARTNSRLTASTTANASSPITSPASRIVTSDEMPNDTKALPLVRVADNPKPRSPVATIVDHGCPGNNSGAHGSWKLNCNGHSRKYICTKCGHLVDERKRNVGMGQVWITYCG